MPITIFISYGRDHDNPRHIELIRRFKLDLEREGFKVLIDEEQLRASDDWTYELEQMILESDWILFFITPYSARRPNGFCLNELAFSLYTSKNIAPVMVDFTVPPLSICRIQYLDLLQYNEEVHKNKLREIITVLRGEKKLEFEGGHTALLKDLKPMKFEGTIAKHMYRFVGRQWVYESVNEWLTQQRDSRILYITAEAGAGKTALSTFLSQKHPECIGIHYCQYDASVTREPVKILQSLIYQLSTQLPEYHELLLGENISEKLSYSPADIFRELIEEPLKRISRPPKELFFVIDALDEAANDGKNALADLIANRFTDLPEWLNLIITSRPEPELLRKLRRFTPVELKAQDERNLEDLRTYIQTNLFQTLDDTLVKFLLAKSEGSILYLEMLNDKENGIDWQHISQKEVETLPKGMEAFYLQMFERRFENTEQYEQALLPYVSVLVAAREEMPSPLLHYVLECSKREEIKMRKRFGSLIEETEHGIVFYHKSLYDWLENYDLSGDYSADIQKGNELISERLWKGYQENDPNLPQGYEGYLLRALFEAQSWENLESALKDILLIGRMYDQYNQEQYKDVLVRALQSGGSINKKALQIYESFIREKEHLILKVNEQNWKPHQSIFQLAYEDGNNSPLSIQAEKYLSEGRVNFLWLKRRNRSECFVRTGLLKVVPARVVDTVVELQHGNILSYSRDFSAQIWSSDGEIIADMFEHINHIEEAFQLKGGQIVSYAFNMLKIWNIEGKILAELRKHTRTIDGAFELFDGRILSYSAEEYCIWSKKGELLSFVKDHDRYIKFMLEFENRQILSFSKSTISIRNYECELLDEIKWHNRERHTNKVLLSNDKYITINSTKFTLLLNGELELKGHTDEIIGVTELKNDKILSFSRDETLCLWNGSGKLLCVMKGHTDSIYGAGELKNGQILSYSENEIILWSSTGKFLSKTDRKRRRKYENSILQLKNGNKLSYRIKEERLYIWNGNVKDEVIEEYYKQKRQDLNIIKLKKGGFLSFLDNTDILHIIDNNGREISVMKGDVKSISQVKELHNGHIVGYSKNESDLYLWSNSGVLVKKLQGHTDDIIGIEELSNGRIVGYSKNESDLYLWSNSGVLVKKLQGHTDDIIGIEELSNGRILTFSRDATLRMWDENGEVIIVLKEHTKSVLGAIELKDGSILSYALDSTLMLWDNNGYFLQVIDTFRDDYRVIDIFERPDGQLLVNIYSREVGDSILCLYDNKFEIATKIESRYGGLVINLHILNHNNFFYADTLYNNKGQEIKTFEEHDGGSILELSDNQLLCYGQGYYHNDRQLILDNDGQILTTLKGKIDYISGVIELQNNILLIYSNSEASILLWNTKKSFTRKLYIATENFIFQDVKKHSIVGTKENNIVFYDIYQGNTLATEVMEDD